MKSLNPLIAWGTLGCRYASNIQQIDKKVNLQPTNLTERIFLGERISIFLCFLKQLLKKVIAVNCDLNINLYYNLWTLTIKIVCGDLHQTEPANSD